MLARGLFVRGLRLQHCIERWTFEIRINRCCSELLSNRDKGSEYLCSLDNDGFLFELEGLNEIESESKIFTDLPTTAVYASSSILHIFSQLQAKKWQYSVHSSFCFWQLHQKFDPNGFLQLQDTATLLVILTFILKTSKIMVLLNAFSNSKRLFDLFLGQRLTLWCDRAGLKCSTESVKNVTYHVECFLPYIWFHN